MDIKKEAKKYLNKYFKSQYLNETDDEYKSLVRLLNKALRIHDVSGRSEQLESGLTCMMCRKPKQNDGHTCCEECAGLAF